MKIKRKEHLYIPPVEFVPLYGPPLVFVVSS